MLPHHLRLRRHKPRDLLLVEGLVRRESRQWGAAVGGSSIAESLGRSGCEGLFLYAFPSVHPVPAVGGGGEFRRSRFSGWGKRDA